MSKALHLSLLPELDLQISVMELWKGPLQSARADQVLQGLQFLSSQLLRNACLTRLYADDTWFQQSLQQQLFILLACLEGLFPSFLRKPGSEFCELLMPLHLDFTACMQLQCWKEPQQVPPKSSPSIWKLLCHRKDSLEFPLPIPPTTRS